METHKRSPLGYFEGDMTMDKIYTDQHASLAEIADKLLEDLDEEEFGGQVRPTGRLRKLFYTGLVCTAIGGFSTLAYYAYQFGHNPADTSQLQIVKADTSPYKEKPADPGGMEVPNMDKTVYDSITGNASGKLPKVERILPPPEEPMVPHQAFYEPAAGGEEVPPLPPPPSLPEMMENREIKPVVVTPPPAPSIAEVAAEEETVEPAPKMEAVPQKPQEMEVAKPPAASPSVLKPISEKDLKVVPQGSKISAAIPATPPKVITSGGHKIQLGAYRSAAEAAREGDRLKKRFPDELKGLEYFIERKDLGEKGVFYRLQAGPFDNSGNARLICKKLVEYKQGCFFVESR